VTRATIVAGIKAVLVTGIYAALQLRNVYFELGYTLGWVTNSMLPLRSPEATNTEKACIVSIAFATTEGKAGT
jgi:hypothetical protein